MVKGLECLWNHLVDFFPAIQAVWYLKCRALTLQDALDDTELEEEGVAELLLDDNATASVPRYMTQGTG